MESILRNGKEREFELGADSRTAVGEVSVAAEIGEIHSRESDGGLHPS
jgi:hypothetical protein